MNNDQCAASAAALELQCGPSRPPLRRLAEELAFREPIEAVPRGCARQAKVVGLFTLLGHPAFYILWTLWAPQPYENLWLRLAMAACGVCLIALPEMRQPHADRSAGVLYTLLLWLTLPFFFSWMFLFNSASTPSVVAMGAMFLIYYQLTDWRLASLGTAGALLAVRLLAPAAGWDGMDVTVVQWASDLAVLAFCWIVGWFLSLSSIGMRRSQAKSAFSAVGIFAHELRTPLATLHMLAHAVREVEPGSERAGDRLAAIAKRLEGTIQRMNRQIDLQISTARMRAAPDTRERVRAADLVNGVVASFPFRDTEAEWLTVQVTRDFEFIGSPQLFTQVLENLLSNAVRALHTVPGDRAKQVSVSIDVRRNVGVLTCRDNGVGMSPDLVARLFEPFVSTQGGGTHGLGLTFCAETVCGAGGEIHVASTLGVSTEFTIHLPRV